MKKLFTLIALAAAVFSTGRAQNCDTVFNLQSPLDSPTIIVADTGSGAGYLSGNNLYGDLAMAEGFGVVDSGYYLIGATIGFGYVTINPTDSNNTVTVYAWDNSGLSVAGNGAPGLPFDSVELTLGQIATAVGAGKGLHIFFQGNDSIYTDTIFVGVELPSIDGDTVVLLTNSAPPGPDGNGWELNATGLWNSYNNNWDVTSGSLGNYLSIGACQSPPTGRPAAYFTESGTPNSTCSPFTVNFTDYTATDDTTLAQYSWFWSFGDGGTSNVQNPTYTYQAGGTYTATETVTRNDTNDVRVLVPYSVTINVLSTPSVSYTTTPATDTVTDGALTAGSATITVSGGSGYYFATWEDGTYGNTDVPGAPGEADTTTVTVLDQNGCSTETTVIVPLTVIAGIEYLNAKTQVDIFPNPASNLLNIVSDDDFSGFTMQVFDALGRMVSGSTLNGSTNTFNVTSLSNGVYILKIMDKMNTSVVEAKFSVVR